MSVPVSIETFVVDGTPQSVAPLVYSIDSVCREKEDVVASYAIIPGYASAECYEDASQAALFIDPRLGYIESICKEREDVVASYAVIPGYASAECVEDVSQAGSFIDTRTVFIEAFSTDMPRINGGFEEFIISADCISVTPIDPGDAQAASEAAFTFFDPDDATPAGVQRISQSIAVFVQDEDEEYVFVSVLDPIFVSSVAVGTSNTEKTPPPTPFTAMCERYQSPDEVAFDERLEDVYATASVTGTSNTEKTPPPTPFTAMCERYQSPDEVAFDERLEDIAITATVTGVYSTEPLKPKVIEAYSGQSPDDESLGRVGGTQGFFWG